MSLIKAFTDAFKKAAGGGKPEGTELTELVRSQGGSLGSTTDGGAFTPLRPAPEQDGDTAIDPAGLGVAEDPDAGGEIASSLPPDEQKQIANDMVRVSLRGDSSDPQEGGEIVEDPDAGGEVAEMNRILLVDLGERELKLQTALAEGSEDLKIAEDPDAGGEVFRGTEVKDAHDRFGNVGDPADVAED